MKLQSTTFNSKSLDPWIVVLAVIVALLILFFFCVTRVQANLEDGTGFYPKTSETNSLILKLKKSDYIPKSQVWYGDFSDISNERAAPPQGAVTTKNAKASSSSRAKATKAVKEETPQKF